MLKKFALLALMLTVLGCTACESLANIDVNGKAQPNGPESVGTQASSQAQNGATPQSDELKGMWIAFFELGQMFESENGFESEFLAALDKCVESGFNAVFVHVRSHCDAYYASAIFPRSKYCGSAAFDFDPLEFMVEQAHIRGIELHAWINPYRVMSDSTDIASLDDKSPAKIWLSDGDDRNDSYVTEYDGGLYLNPAEAEVHRLIADGVREIVKGYAVDGIHFDDYFYPTVDESFDEAQYAAYRAAAVSNPLPLNAWRRANVSAMVAAVYNAVKAERGECVFGISPMASIAANYSTVYADCAEWLEAGIVDYIMPQLYFGFEYEDESMRFDSLLKAWNELVNSSPKKLYIGLGSYRVGTTSSGLEEWSKNADILARQIELLRADGVSDGFVIYSYTTFYKEDELSSAVRSSVAKAMGE